MKSKSGTLMFVVFTLAIALQSEKANAREAISIDADFQRREMNRPAGDAQESSPQGEASDAKNKSPEIKTCVTGASDQTCKLERSKTEANT